MLPRLKLINRFFPACLPPIDALAASRLAPIILGIFSFLFSCCGFVDLRPIGISTVPDGSWAMLPGAESHILICFDTEMEKYTAEKALQIYSPLGVADGVLRWAGNNLHFIPAVPWMAGIRYSLKLSGTVTAMDGRELLLSRDIPFYAVARSSLPYVNSFFPLDGISVGVSVQTILELDFSVPMDRRSSEDALRLDIPGGKFFEWHNGDTTLRVTSDKPLDPWIVYKWSITEKALSKMGAPLAKEVSGRFISDLNREFIKVIRLVPLLSPKNIPAAGLWGGWVPAGLNLEQGPGPGQGIGVEFSKEADSESLRRAFSFTPSIPGRVEILSPVTAVYIPAKDPEPETVYSLRISGAMKDIDGLKMGEDFTAVFRTDIPYLKISSVSSADDEEISDPAQGGVFRVPVNTGGKMSMTIHFSHMFHTENPVFREECVFRISLNPFFPATLPSISLRTALWISSDTLFLEWEGAEGGRPGETHYYKLVIPGGAAGIHNGMGSYLKENFVLYLEAES